MNKPLSILSILLALLHVSLAQAGSVFVKVQTNLGAFTLELDSGKAPITVANFLTYLNEGFYKDTIFHRSPKNFVVQGGGFDLATFLSSTTPKATHAPIVNESTNGLSNLRGTIAMARLSDPNYNSATSQFYINVVDNIANTGNINLDYRSANTPGYAVFGKVVAGMETVDAINALPVASKIYTTVPTVYQDLPIVDAQNVVPAYIQAIALLEPIANAGRDFSVESGASATLDGSGSSDPTPGQSQPLGYQWTQTAGPAVQFTGGPNIAKPGFIAPEVAADTVLSFRLVVTGASGSASTNDAAVNVTVKAKVIADPNRLDCSQATPNRTSLWPANKALVAVGILGVTPPNTYDLTITGVASDEPVRAPAAKDRTGPDAKIRKGKATRKQPHRIDSVLLRAERQLKQKSGAGSGNGRVYTVSFTANDGVQSCTGSVQIAVPPQKGQAAIDDGPQYAATQRQ